MSPHNMSQDLLREFDTFSRPPPPSPLKTPIPSFQFPTNSSNSRPGQPSNLPPNRNNIYSHRPSASTSAFDDLLSLTSTAPPHHTPSYSQSSTNGRPNRLGPPTGFHGRGQSMSIVPDLDPFASFSTSSFGSLQPPPLTRNNSDGPRFGHVPSASYSVSSSRSRSRSRSPQPPRRPAAPPISFDDDEFGDFISTSSSNPPPPPPPPLQRPTPSSSRPPHIRQMSLNFIPKAQKPSVLPSVPVPPVAILLTLFPPLFTLPSTALLNKLTHLPFPIRQRILSHPSTRRFLFSICEFGRVCGRIIAGRLRRRKRIIGKANSQDAAREEREVKEIVRIWGENAGRLKAALNVPVPELGEHALAVAQGGKGGLGCRLCGLEEREVVEGLKEGRHGERWWDWGWGGHGSCRAFWEKHGGALVKS